MAEEKKKKEKKCEEGAPEYMVTYGDLMSLLLTFFIMLLSAAKIEGQEIRLILANFPGLGNLLGGQSFNEGKLPFSGQVHQALPSSEHNFALNRFKKDAIQVFESELKSETIVIDFTERGLVISLFSDFYFEKYSANFNVEEKINVIRKLATILREFFNANPNEPYKIEGYTDEMNFPTGNIYIDEWGLSSARAVTILRLFEQFLVPTKNVQVSGYGNTRPKVASTGGGSPFNRRVDIILLNEGNL